ncbi:MAG: hypothetical protein PQJ44_06840 [Sphaerochaetaceae bacterium]|nr:hypothetical protein [Sphaerochaetaceae bacterium]
MAVELKIKIKTEDSTHNVKFLVYEEFIMKYDDKTILEYIKQAKEKLNIEECEIDDIKIQANLQVK